MTAIRIARRLVRKATKPLALWLTECQLEKSRDDAKYIASVRAELVDKERQESLHQVRLMQRRNEIAGW